MRGVTLTYVLLSPTFGMHQYTADLANRAASGWKLGAGSWNARAPGRLEAAHSLWRPGAEAGEEEAGGEERGEGEVRLVTTATLPRDRYCPAVQVQAPVTTRGTGFSREGLDPAACRRAYVAILRPASHRARAPEITCGPEPSRRPGAPASSFQLPATGFQPPASGAVHFTGVHAWNVLLVRGLQRRGVRVIHTLHDLDPHHGVRHGGLIRLWNRLIIASGCHILVHGRRYRDALLAQGVPAARVTCAPLLHGFLGWERGWPPAGVAERRNAGRKVNVLFFGRVEAYKGVDVLLAAWELLARAPKAADDGEGDAASLTIAGPVAAGVELPALPPGVELRDRRIGDDEGDALFRQADLLVLPYRDATQSALVAAAYAYGLPVVVTRAGALPECVDEGRTGWVAEAGDAAGLVAVLREALADPLRLRRMGEAGRAWFEARRRDETAALREMYGWT